MTSLGQRFDASLHHPGVDVGWVEPDELAELAVGNSSLLDEPAHESGRDGELRGYLADIEQGLVCGVACVVFRVHAGVKASSGHRRDIEAQSAHRRHADLSNASARIMTCASRESALELCSLRTSEGIGWDGPEWGGRIGAVDEATLCAPFVDVSDEGAEAVEVEVERGKRTVLAEHAKVLVQPCRSLSDDLRDIVCAFVIVVVEELSDRDLGCRVQRGTGDGVPPSRVGGLMS